jgi:hypothetical protein
VNEADVPVVDLTVADVFVLLLAALERGDLQAADRWAGVLLQRNDAEDRA